jgi:isoquinoline 1-oxidoreductase subunit alpha
MDSRRTRVSRATRRRDAAAHALHPGTATRNFDGTALAAAAIFPGIPRAAGISAGPSAQTHPAALRVYAMVNIKINGVPHQLDVEDETPLLWVIREEIGLTGTKFGCGIAACGACTVHVNGEAVRSCVVPISTIADAEVTTIEGLSPDSNHPVQQAWLQEEVPQCGYCQSGQIMAVTAFLKSNPRPTDADIDANLTNICRCGTYERLRRAVHRAAATMKI